MDAVYHGHLVIKSISAKPRPRRSAATPLRLPKKITAGNSARWTEPGGLYDEANPRLPVRGPDIRAGVVVVRHHRYSSELTVKSRHSPMAAAQGNRLPYFRSLLPFGDRGIVRAFKEDFEMYRRCWISLGLAVSLTAVTAQDTHSPSGAQPGPDEREWIGHDDADIPVLMRFLKSDEPIVVRAALVELAARGPKA